MSIESAIKGLKDIRMHLPAPQVLPDDALLDSYEIDLGFPIEGSYRTFLKEASDTIYNGKDALRVTPLRDSPRELLTHAKEAWAFGVPQSWLPICEDNGNYYCLTRNGDVRYWSHDGTSSDSWPTLEDWIHDVWIEGN